MAASFYEYAANYNKAAHLITLSILDTDKPSIAELDTYFFSLAFLYRHSIELILKAIAFQHLCSITDRAQCIKDTFHNLDEILKYIERFSPSPRPNAEMEWLRSYLGDSSKLDKESDSFRYPFHIISEKDEWSGGRRYSVARIFEKQTHIDLIKFANKFEAAYEILDKWYLKDSGNAVERRDLAPVFIEEGGYYYGQSVVGYGYNRDDFYPYTKAYLETANYLRDHMKSQKDANTHVETELFLPMCYLYRNCAELSLKAVWFQQTKEDHQIRCKQMSKKKHSILGMWNLIKPYAIKYSGGEGDLGFIADLEDYCSQLHALDCDASKFRYPVQKDMQPYFRNHQTFDYENAGAFLEALNNAVDCIEMQLSVINEQIAEMEAEYRSYYSEY